MAARPDIAMVEGATLTIILDAELTLRCSLPAHRLLLADGTTLCSSVGSVTAKDIKELFWNTFVQLAPNYGRCAQRLLSHCQEGARDGCIAPPPTAAVLGRAEPASFACSHTLGSPDAQEGRFRTDTRPTLSYIWDVFPICVICICDTGDNSCISLWFSHRIGLWFDHVKITLQNPAPLLAGPARGWSLECPHCTLRKSKK